MRKNDLKQEVSIFAKAVVSTLAAAIIGYLLLIIVFALPQEPQYENIKESREVLEGEGISFELIEGYSSLHFDNYTEGLTFNSAIYSGTEKLTEKAAAIHQYVYEGCMYYDSLFRYLDGDDKYEIGQYARDWHGYLIFVKPLLLVLNYSQIRIFNLIIQLVLISMILFILCKKKRELVIPFVVMLLFMSAPVIWLSMEYSALYIITLISILLLLRYENIIDSRLYISLFFTCIGIAVAYVDVLTYPMLTFGIPMVMIYVLSNHKSNIKDYLSMLIRGGFYWLSGYAGMWGLKWIIATIFTDQNIIKEAILMALYRMSSTSAESGEVLKIGITQVLKNNFGVYWHWPYGVIILLYAIMVIVRLARKQYTWKKSYFLVTVVLCLLPIVWYVLVKNHSYIHYWMTHRNIVLIVFALCCFEAQSRKDIELYDKED